MMTPTLPFSLSQRIEALFRERGSLSEEQITYQVQELLQSAATSQDRSLIADALQKKTIELGSCPAIEKALEILNGGQKRVREEGISSSKKKQATDPSASSSSENSSIIQQVWQWADQARKDSPLLAHPPEWNASSISIISADGEGTLSPYHLFLLAVHSEFVFSLLRFNVDQQREEQPIVFQDFSLSIIQKIACILEGEFAPFPQEEENFAILEAARSLQLNKYALELLSPFYIAFFQNERKSVQEFIAYLGYFQDVEMDLPLLADEVLYRKLCRMNLKQILEEISFPGLQPLIFFYRKYPDSQVHKILRSLFTPFVVKVIDRGIFEENLNVNRHLSQLAPPIELTITSSNIYLLKHPFVKKHLTHCTIAVGYKEFYLEVLNVLQESFPMGIKRLSVENGLFLSTLPEEYRNDRNIVLAAVKQDGYALRYASEELRGDPNIVLTAVTQNGWALEYLSEELRNNRKIVLAAIKQDRRAFQYASTLLQNDTEFMREAGVEEQSVL